VDRTGVNLKPNGVNMKIVLAFAFAGLLAASPALAGLAGDTPNTGPEGTGNFVAGKPGNPAKGNSGRSATKAKNTTSGSSSR
jgi:hypothetical protein